MEVRGALSDELSGRTPTYRVARSRGLDPATKRLALIAVGLGSALFVVIGAWSAMGAGGGSIPVIAPPAGPVRVKPADPGGMKLAGENDFILSGSAENGSAGKLAPLPETPDPQALTPTAEPLTAAEPPAAVPARPNAPVSPATAPTAASRGTDAAPPTRPAEPPAPASATDKDATIGQAPAGGANTVVVQLAALPTKEEAEAEWHVLERRMPKILGSRAPSIVRAEIDGRTWWRVRAGGFADPTQARDFCERVRAKGSACSVARF